MSLKMKSKIRISTKQNFVLAFKNLYTNGVLTDCTLWCKNGSVKAHKLVLAAVSPHFRKIFTEHAGNNSVYMYGVAVEQLRQLIELIYKGFIDLPNQNSQVFYDLAKSLEINELFLDGTPRTKVQRPLLQGQKRIALDYELAGGSLVKIPKTKAVRHDNSSVTISSSEAEEPIRIDSGSSTGEESDADHMVGREQLAAGATVIGHNVDDITATGQCSNTWDRERMYKCLACPASFKRAHHLTRHQFTHTEERPFTCGSCPASFKRASHLTRHEFTHTGEKPHACDLCGKTFYRPDKLKHHILKHHGQLSGDISENLPAEALYAIDHVQILTPEQTMYESSQSLKMEYDSSSGKPIRKRGRPRKILTEQEIKKEGMQKRKRGRPRKNPTPDRAVPRYSIKKEKDYFLDGDSIKKEQEPKRKRGRPRKNPTPEPTPGTVHRKDSLARVKMEDAPTNDQARTPNSDYYDIESIPLDNLQFLTKPTEENSSGNASEHMTSAADGSEVADSKGEVTEAETEGNEAGYNEIEFVGTDVNEQIMEPVIEIDTEENAAVGKQTFMEKMQLSDNNTAIGTIGECTIMVTPH